MVFSSVPLYLDPQNWHHHQQQAQLHQQQNQLVSSHGGAGGDISQHHQIAVQMPPPVPSQAVGGSGSSSSIRPGSMADRARQAKLPQPEPGLKCPRCESTNTKFCYFNNYSLTQPRHFCKTCRRYWTRGGALRNVPVGGGCRRNNKRSSKAGGASKVADGERQTGTNPNNYSTSSISSNSKNTDMNNNHGPLLETTTLPSQSFQPRMTQFPLLASLQGLTHGGQYGSSASNLGLNFGGMIGSAAQAELGFQIGGSTGANLNQWRPHHFPNFLAGFDPPPQPPSASSSLYQFPIDHQSMDQTANQPPRSSITSAMNQQPIRTSIPPNSSGDHDHNNNEAAVKAEDASHAGMSLLSRPFLGMSDNNHQYWVGNNNNNNNWSDQLSGLNSSSTNHNLL